VEQVVAVKSFEMADVVKAVEDLDTAKTGAISRADDMSDQNMVGFWVSASEVGSRDMLCLFRHDGDEGNNLTCVFSLNLPAPPEVGSLFLEICNRWNAEDIMLTAAIVPEQGVILKTTLLTAYPLAERDLLLWVGVAFRKAVRFCRFFEEEFDKL